MNYHINKIKNSADIIVYDSIGTISIDKIDMSINGIDRVDDIVEGDYMIDSPLVGKHIIHIIGSDNIDGDNVELEFGLSEIFKRLYYVDFVKFNNKKLNISKRFFDVKKNIAIMSKENARKILKIDEFSSTAFGFYIPNPDEVDTVANKLKFPIIITKSDKIKEVFDRFSYNRGLVLSFFIIALFGFFIIIIEKATTISQKQKREIYILRLLNWSIKDIINTKLIQNGIIVNTGAILGVVLSLFFVYILKAPIIKNIFDINYFYFEPMFDIISIVEIIILIVAIYILATIIPIWKNASIDDMDSMR
jgi:ABC-type antimicrobial peptide transport system permease subunit